MTVLLPQKKFTLDEVNQMEEAGLFAGRRFELIDGNLIDKMGHRPPHASAIYRCTQILARLFGLGLIRSQLPIQAGDRDRKWSEPQPDFAVVHEYKSEFESRHPVGTELALVIEVSDTTLAQDKTTKRDIYARCGVPEYWVLDLNGRALLVHRDLDITRANYGNIRVYREGEFVSVASQEISVSSLLPQA
jgi:Uma2 family endonuclease